MGIYLPNMEMPKSCLSCPLQGGTADCRLTQKTYNWGLPERPSDCPLVPVPPHGRLKDYDRIMKEYDEWFSKTECRGYENMFYALRLAINGSPTIIPAEEGET